MGYTTATAMPRKNTVKTASKFARPSRDAVDQKLIDRLLKQAERTEPRLKTAIPKISRAYNLTGLEDRLADAFQEAFGDYYLWWARHCNGKRGFGSKARILAMKRALSSILSGLHHSQTRNRILAAAPGTAQTNRKWFRESAEALEELLKVFERASTIDGRQLNGPRRDDIHAAAEPLRHFWVADAKRKGSLYLREGRHPEKIEYSEAVRFLHACLSLIDDSVTPRMLVELNK